MAVVSRLKINHPVLGASGGASLYSAIEGIYQKIGDSISSRWFLIQDFDATEIVDLDHNFETGLSNLRFDIYKKTGSEWVLLTQTSSPLRSSFSISAKTGDELKVAQITNSSGTSNLEVAVCVVNDPIHLLFGDVSDVDISAINDGETLVYNSAQKKFLPGAAGGGGGGGSSVVLKTVSSNYTVESVDDKIIVSGHTARVKITLPDFRLKGRSLTITNDSPSKGSDSGLLYDSEVYVDLVIPDTVGDANEKTVLRLNVGDSAVLSSKIDSPTSPKDWLIESKQRSKNKDFFSGYPSYIGGANGAGNYEMRHYGDIKHSKPIWVPERGIFVKVTGTTTFPNKIKTYISKDAKTWVLKSDVQVSVFDNADLGTLNLCYAAPHNRFFVIGKGRYVYHSTNLTSWSENAIPSFGTGGVACNPQENNNSGILYVKELDRLYVASKKSYTAGGLPKIEIRCESTNDIQNIETVNPVWEDVSLSQDDSSATDFGGLSWNPESQEVIGIITSTDVNKNTFVFSSSSNPPFFQRATNTNTALTKKVGATVWAPGLGTHFAASDKNIWTSKDYYNWTVHSVDGINPTSFDNLELTDLTYNKETNSVIVATSGDFIFKIGQKTVEKMAVPDSMTFDKPCKGILYCEELQAFVGYNPQTGYENRSVTFIFPY